MAFDTTFSVRRMSVKHLNRSVNVHSSVLYVAEGASQYFTLHNTSSRDVQKVRPFVPFWLTHRQT